MPNLRGLLFGIIGGTRVFARGLGTILLPVSGVITVPRLASLTAGPIGQAVAPWLGSVTSGPVASISTPFMASVRAR
jgi:hypothetical protein